MTRVHVFCEGQTEESFIWHVLYEDLCGIGVYLNPILVSASLRGKGGLAHYGGVKRQILRKCREDQSAYATTMFDLFRLPVDFPGQSHPKLSAIRDPLEKANFLEEELQKDIGQRNFIANLTVHFTESSLSGPPRFTTRKSIIPQLSDSRTAFRQSSMASMAFR